MLVAALSRLLSAWFVFLLPCYATFKALSHPPLSAPDLHKWSVYWTVIGAFMAVESVAEWLVSWQVISILIWELPGHLIDPPLRLPFYWELKTLFLLFLALPQTEGTTYLYNAYLQPFFSRNEAEFDAGIIRIQQNTLTFLQEKLTRLWNTIWTISTRNHPESHASPPPAPGSQWMWLLSPDAWRSAIDVLQPTTNPSFPSTPSRPQNPRTASSRSSSNSQQEAVGKQPPSFPVPQHYQ